MRYYTYYKYLRVGCTPLAVSITNPFTHQKKLEHRSVVSKISMIYGRFEGSWGDKITAPPWKICTLVLAGYA
jgi:hypothetical protein